MATWDNTCYDPQSEPWAWCGDGVEGYSILWSAISGRDPTKLTTGEREEIIRRAFLEGYDYGEMDRGDTFTCQWRLVPAGEELHGDAMDHGWFYASPELIDSYA